MSFVKFFKSLILFMLLFFASWQETQAIMATAYVDTAIVVLGDTFTLSIDVIGESQYRMPNLTVPGCSIVAKRSMSKIVSQNGRVVSTRIYSYEIQPHKAGTITVPSVRIEYKGEYSDTQPINVEVIDNSSQKKKSSKKSRAPSRQSYDEDEDEPEEESSSTQPSSSVRQQPSSNYGIRQSAPLLLTAETDKTSAYPGEQINLSVTFYTSVPLADNPQYTPPAFKNFVSEELPPVRNGQKVLENGGAMYGYSEIKTALFALSAGKGEIAEATVIANVSVSAALDPFDPNFIQNFMSGRVSSTEKKVLKSRPISIKIKPLPAGAPESFSGAVGSYSMRSNVEQANYKEGEPFNFTVSISGTGNLSSVTAPKFPESADFKVFDTQVSSTQSRKNDKVGGKKVFTYLLVPRSRGKKTIPKLVFSYFDPSAGHYYALTSKQVEIEVAKGDSSSKSVYFNQPVSGEQSVAATASDIKYVKEKGGAGLFAKTADKISSAPYWVHSLPAIAFALMLGMMKMSSYKQQHSQLFRFRGARSKAYRQIDEAYAMIKGGQPSEAVSMLYDAFMDYLSDKCGEKVSAMKSRKALEVISERFPKAEAGELENIRSLWQELEMHHYAPGKADTITAEALADRCRLTLKMLDGKLK